MSLPSKVLISLGVMGSFILSPLSLVSASAESTLAYWGTTMKENSSTYFAGAAYALNGDIFSNGFLVRVSGSVGGYNYDTVSVIGGNVEVAMHTADVLLGYQHIEESFKISGYAGFNLQNREYTPLDPNTTTAGERTGVKAQFDLRTTPQSPIFFNLLGNYSTATESYYVRGRTGAKVGGLTVGPEAISLGNESNESYRVGAFVSGVDLGEVSVTVSGGYSYANDGFSQDSPYFSVSMSNHF